MRNIISNALKFTRENGIVIINLSIECKENCYCDNINDNINDDIRDDIKVDIKVDDNEDDNQNNFDSSVINNDKYFLKMTVKDSGPGITKVR